MTSNLSSSAVGQYFDEYGRKARLAPAILCLPPYLLIGHLIIWPSIDPSIRSALAITAGDITYSIVMLYLLIQVHRLISKLLFEDRSRLPTTEALMPDGWLSREYRAVVAERVSNDFDLCVPDAAAVAADGAASVRRCEEIGSLIVGKVAKGRLLHQHNIEYGFCRNLSGGAVLATITSAAAAVAFKWMWPNPKALLVAFFLFVLYSILSLCAKPLLRHFSREYARILFREYLGDATGA